MNDLTEEKELYSLIEQHGLHKGEVIRSEAMTPEAAEERNRDLCCIKWEYHPARSLSSG